MKKLLVAAVTGMLFLSSTLSADAAGLKDIFNAKYYADQYADLKEAYGYDEEQLFQHFMAYGLEEGRSMNPVLDLKKYRESYEDLDAAFGDNWDAYVQHYLDFGIEEGRDNGTDFDVKTYLEAYADIAEAFGDNYGAVVNHYLTYGLEENRTKGNPAVYQASLNVGSSSSSGNTGSVEEWTYEEIYDENGVLIRENNYYNGVLDNYVLFIYGEDGRMCKREFYDASDVLTMYSEHLWEADGSMDKIIWYSGEGFKYMTVDEYENDLYAYTLSYYNGVLQSKTEYTQNEQGETVTIWTNYYNGNESDYYVRYSANDKIIKEESYQGGVLVNTKEYEYYSDGTYKAFTKDDSTGLVTWSMLYDAAGHQCEERSYYYQDGSLLRHHVTYYYARSCKTYQYEIVDGADELMWWSEKEFHTDEDYVYYRKASTTTTHWSDGSKWVEEYDENDNRISVTKYDANGNLIQ